MDLEMSVYDKIQANKQIPQIQWILLPVIIAVTDFASEQVHIRRQGCFLN